MTLSFDPATLRLPKGHFIDGRYVEGADALAHRRRRDPEVAGGGLEAPVGHNGREGPGLVRMNVNH